MPYLRNTPFQSRKLIIGLLPLAILLVCTTLGHAQDDLLDDSSDDLLLESDSLLSDDLLTDDPLLDDDSDSLLNSDDDLLGGDSLTDDDALLMGDDDLLGGDDDLLGGEDSLTDDDALLGGDGDDLLTPSDATQPAQETPGEIAERLTADAERAHFELMAAERFPSASSCRSCHPTHYEQWSVSPHAYAQISPVFNAMHSTVFLLTNGSNGDFCIRCHTPVGMNLPEPEIFSNVDRIPASREGITCIACHRINKNYGKVSGRLAINEGDLLEPVFGPRGNAELKRVLDTPDIYRVQTERDKPGRKIHTEARFFEPITHSGFCGTCHDVNLLNGFRLEEAFSDFKAAPASGKGVSCQDCHMGKLQGKIIGDPSDREAFEKSNFDYGPAAIIGKEPTADRKLTNHVFAGPDHSIVHPGIFPHNSRASEFATIREWVTFDVEAGWGTDEFEDNIPDGYVFPERWESIDDRYDARAILDVQFELLDWYNEKRLEVLRNAFAPGEFEVDRLLFGAAKLSMEVKNLTDGHSAAVGFDAERVIFLRTVLTDSSGDVVFVSGDLDPNGDLRDSHSLYVHNGELPIDKQLFSLQSKFLVRMRVGGDREQVLPINFSPNSLPLIRPSERSTILTGRPAGARVQRNNIDPLGSRTATYKIPRKNLRGTSGPYRVKFEFIQGMVPVNLIEAISKVGFEYDMTPREVAEAVVDGHRVIWEKEYEIDSDFQTFREIPTEKPLSDEMISNSGEGK